MAAFLVAAVAVGGGIVGATAAGGSGTDFEPVLNTPFESSGVEQSGQKVTPLSVSDSPQARAVAGALPDGFFVRAAESRDWSPALYDVVDARSGPEGSGYSISIFRKAALHEYEEAAAAGDLEAFAVRSGQAWAAPDDAAIQGIYYASDAGVVLSVTHYSQNAEDHVTREELVEIAQKTATTLAADDSIDARATLVNRGREG